MSKYINKLGIGKFDLDIFENKEYAKGWNAAVDIIENTNTADMKEVQYGEWIEQEKPYINTYECSNCKHWFVLEDGTPEENNYNYCPNCGADMKGKLTHD